VAANEIGLVFQRCGELQLIGSGVIKNLEVRGVNEVICVRELNAALRLGVGGGRQGRRKEGGRRE